MLKTTEEKILANSRLALVNTNFIPMMIGCIVIAAIYFTSNFLIDAIFGFAWLGIAFFSYKKYKKAIKQVVEACE